MNKWKGVVALSLLLASGSTQADRFIEGKQYISADKAVADAPAAVKFFSFYCPGCYQYDQIFKVNDNVRQALPKGVVLDSYHVSFMGELGHELSKAWAAARMLEVEELIVGPMFDGVQKTKSVNDEASIRQVFIDAGVKGEVYDVAINSFAVKAAVKRQEKMAADLNVTSVPAVYIQGQHRINPQGLDQSSADAFVKDFRETVAYLLMPR
ncbi:TPA: thioredoxin domain-containing protein [Escherichia coli]|nr:thioredoxin domain-containing protein [Escherichia coli]HCQ0091569.1 DsbA family protein [Escherichia coli]